jgi:hypothetical protein
MTSAVSVCCSIVCVFSLLVGRGLWACALLWAPAEN